MPTLAPRRYRQATVAGLLAATGALALGIERLVAGRAVLGGLALALGVALAVLVLSLDLEGASTPSPVLLLTREECPHCDEARAIVNHLQDELGFDLWEVDITSDAELVQAYGSDVPVVVHEGRRVASLEVREEDLRSALTEPASPGS